MNTSIKNASIATKSTITTIVAVTLVSMLLLLAITTTTTAAKPFQNAPVSLANDATTIGDDAAVDNSSSTNSNKVVLLAFYDNPKSQFENAKPILDKYGFKATFFVVCNWLGRPDRMTWQDINTLQDEGHDIESHSMNHKRLNHLSASDLDFEIGQSKKCLADHNMHSPAIFGSPHGIGWDNSTVVNTIAKYYEFGRQGNAAVMSLHCDGYTKHSSQTDCRTYFDNGTLTFANRYSIREWSHTNIDKKLLFDDNNKIFDAFVREVNDLPAKFNSNLIITTSTTTTLNAIPIVSYHSIDKNNNNIMINSSSLVHDSSIENKNSESGSTDIDEFAKEMKYLHDNGFTVLPVSSLKYNKDGNYFHLDFNSDNNHKGSDNGSSQNNSNNTNLGRDRANSNDDGDITITITTNS